MAEVQFTTNLSTALRGTEAAARRALEIIGGMAETHAKEQLVANGSVVTGRLMGSITHEVEGDGRAVVIGTNVEYAPFVELGHRQEPGRYVPKLGKRLKADHVAAKPYLRPAVENHTAEYQNVLEIEFRNG